MTREEKINRAYAEFHASEESIVAAYDAVVRPAIKTYKSEMERIRAILGSVVQCAIDD